jgi:hypothetical protein
MSERSDFYVYGLWTPGAFDLDQIRYVGKGCGMRVIARRRSKRVAEWIAEVGEPHFDLLAANMTEAEAFALEIELIAKYGREGIDEGGVLWNVTTGGAGAPGQKMSPDAIAKTVAALRGRPKSAEHRAALSAAKKGKPQTEAQIAGAVARRGWKHTAASRAKLGAALSARNKASWSAMTPEERSEKMADRTAAAATANLGRTFSPEHRAKIAAAQTNPSPETRAKRSVAVKAYLATKSPEERSAAASKAAKALWAKRAAMKIAA